MNMYRHRAKCNRQRKAYSLLISCMMIITMIISFSSYSYAATNPTGKPIIRNTIANSANKTNEVIWDAQGVKGANAWELAWKHKESKNWVSKTLGNVTRGVTTGLSIHGLYQIKVRPLNKNGSQTAYGVWSDTVYRYFHTTEKIRLRSDADGSFTMSWQKNPMATSYQVMYSEYSNGAGAARNISAVGPNATSFTKTGLTPGKTYYVQVREIRTIGKINYIGNISCPVAVKLKGTAPVTKTPTPGKVSGLKVSAKTTNSVTLTWNKLTKNVTGYAIYRDGKYVTAVSTNSYKNTGLTANKTYTYKVRAFYKDGSKYTYGSYASVTATTNKAAANNTSTSNTTTSSKDTAFANSKLQAKTAGGANVSTATVYLDVTKVFYYELKTKKTDAQDAIKWSSSNASVATVERQLWNGTEAKVTCKKAGTVTITATNWDGQKKTVTIKVENKKPTSTNTTNQSNGSIQQNDPNRKGTVIENLFGGGFDVKGYAVKTTGEKDANGKTTMKLRFYTDGGISWTKKNYSFLVSDVTPNAYKKTFRDLGCSDSLRITNISFEESSGSPIVDKPYITIITVTIEAGSAVKAIKLYDANSKVITDKTIGDNNYRINTFYLIPAEKDANGNYWACDDELYRRIRNKISANLWTDDMTTYEKLRVVSNYINSTTHYPGEITSKENNPEFWNDWSVDGIELMYYMGGTRLNSMMKLQGGITTCVAANAIGDFAEDIGLSNIYDYKNDVILDKEGWYVGIGAYSSNPGNPGHETFYYKDVSGKKYSIDTQGIIGNMGNFRCDQHNCKSEIISLK